MMYDKEKQQIQKIGSSMQGIKNIPVLRALFHACFRCKL